MDKNTANMLGSIGGGVASGALGMLDGFLTRRYNERMMDKQNRLNIEQWNRENAYNHPAAVVARLKEAGINPALAYMNGASFAPAAASPNMESPNAKSFGLQMDPLTVSNIRLQEAQAQDLEASARGKEIENEDKGINLRIKKALESDGLLKDFEESKISEQFSKEGVQFVQALRMCYDYLLYTGQMIPRDDGVIEFVYGREKFVMQDNNLSKKRRANMIGSEDEQAAVREANIAAARAKEEYEKKNKLTIESDKQFEDFLMDNKDSWWSILIRGARWLLGSLPSISLPGISFSRKDSHNVIHDNSGHDHHTKIFNNQK